MSDTFERDDEMLLSRDDLVIADDLLEGRLSPADVPAGYERVAELVAAALTPPPPRSAMEIAHASVWLGKLVRAVQRGGIAVTPARVRRTARSAVAAAAVVFALTGTAAAASNNLPDAVQSFVAEAVSHVGISLPSPDDDVAPTVHAHDGNAGSEQSHSPNGPPSSQPGASAGNGGDDQRPACAGDPTAEDPGCAGGVATTEHTPPTADKTTDKGDTGDQGDTSGDDHQGETPTSVAPPTTTPDTRPGNGQGSTHAPSDVSSASTDHPTSSSHPSGKP